MTTTRFRGSSRVRCSVCGHRLTGKDVDYFLSMTDESLHNEVLCRDCMEAHLLLCHECSRYYTADGLCEGCAGRAYGLAS
jgi:hypothetical protein